MKIGSGISVTPLKKGVLLVLSALVLAACAMWVVERGAGSARAAVSTPAVSPPTRPVTLEQIQQLLTSRIDGGQGAALGINADGIAKARTVASLPVSDNILSGAAVVELPAADGGLCLSVLGALTCRSTALTTDPPFLAVLTDLDGPGGMPVAIAAMVGPTVKAVSFTCLGKSYPAAIGADGSIAFVSPDASAPDCGMTLTLADGSTQSF